MHIIRQNRLKCGSNHTTCRVALGRKYPLNNYRPIRYSRDDWGFKNNFKKTLSLTYFTFHLRNKVEISKQSSQVNQIKHAPYVTPCHSIPSTFACNHSPTVLKHMEINQP